MSEGTALSFPPHRRRPIRSHTYFNLIQLFSHCHTDSSQRHGSSDGIGLRCGRAENFQISHGELKSAVLLVPSDILIQGTGSKSIANFGFQDGDFDVERTTVSELDCANLVTNGDEVVACEDSISVGDFLVDGNLNVDSAAQIAGEQGDLDSVHVGSTRQLTVDKGFSIDDFSEAPDSRFGVDMVFESPRLGINSKENNSALEVNTSNEFEHRLQLKEMELEKLVSTSGVNEEIEEGEIYVEAGASDLSILLASENAASLGIISTHNSEGNGHNEEFICNTADLRIPRHYTCVDKENDCMKVELRASSRPSPDIQFQSFADDGYMETQGIDAIPASLETLPLTGLILQKNTNDNPISAITEKDGDSRSKKRKNDPSARERRAGKKKRKRAEKNRKLGIKRLKLRTVLKPKEIVYCRHYLRGKCHEGENCKFSHDTTPLTKSKPCRHFACNSCMKGDDCPFDHQLSKYPCNNYTSTGFCSRGAACLFAHEIPANQILSVTPNVLKPEQRTRPDKAGSFPPSIASKPELKFWPQRNNSNSIDFSDNLTSNQKVDAKFSFPGKSNKSAAKYEAKPFLRTAAHAPKGVSFLTNVSLGQNHQLKLDESAQKSRDAVDVGHEATPKVPSSINRLNEASEGLTSSKPRGVNFLYFAQSSLNVSSSQTFSNLFSDRVKEAGKLVMADLACGKQTHPSTKKVQKVTDLSQNWNGEANRMPVTQPLRMNSISLDKTQLDDSASKEPADKKENTVLSSTEEGPTTPGKFPGKKHPTPFGGSFDQLASAGHFQNIPSSFKTSLLSNTPTLVQKAVQSTLALAAKFEPEIKSGPHHGEARESHAEHLDS